MGTVIVMIVGVLAALSFTKKELYQPWIYLVNVSLAAYISMFASPLILELLPTLPGVAEKYKTAGVLLVTAVIFLVLFYKCVGAVVEDCRVFESFPLPPLISHSCAAVFAFCGGAVSAAFLLMCFAQTPVSAQIKGIDRTALRASSTGVMRSMARTVNAFSFQSMSREAEDTLEKLEKEPPPIPEESLEEKLKAKKAAAAKKAREKARKKMRILENGIAVPVEEEAPDGETKETGSSSIEKTERIAPAEKEQADPPIAKEQTDASAPAEKEQTGTSASPAKSRRTDKSQTRQRSRRSGSTPPSSARTTVYGRAISKAVDVREQVEQKSLRESDGK